MGECKAAVWEKNDEPRIDRPGSTAITRVTCPLLDCTNEERTCTRELFVDHTKAAIRHWGYLAELVPDLFLML
jgi:hypothetical protein